MNHISSSHSPRSKKQFLFLLMLLSFGMQLMTHAMDFDPAEYAIDVNVPENSPGLQATLATLRKLCEVMQSWPPLPEDYDNFKQAPVTQAKEVPSLQNMVVNWLNTNGTTFKQPQNLSKESLSRLSRYIVTCSAARKDSIFKNILDAPGGDRAYWQWKRFALVALLHEGANPNTMNSMNRTLLYESTLHDDDAITRLLFAYCANPNYIEDDFNVPIQHVKTVDIAKLFFKHGQKITSPPHFFKYLTWPEYSPDLVPFYKAQGVDFNITNFRNTTLLHDLVISADRYKNQEALMTKARYLLDAAPALLKVINYHGNTAQEFCILMSNECKSKDEQKNYQALLEIFAEYEAANAKS